MTRLYYDSIKVTNILSKYVRHGNKMKRDTYTLNNLKVLRCYKCFLENYKKDNK